MSLTTEQAAIKKELGVIMELAYEKTMTTRADVFVTYMGHVNGLNVRIFNKGWHSALGEGTEQITPSYTAEFYLVGTGAPSNVPAELAKIIRKLQEL